MTGKRKHVVPFGIVAAGLVGLGGGVSRATPLIFEDFNPAGTGGDLNSTPASSTGLTGNWFNASTPSTNYYTSGSGSGNAAGTITRSAGEGLNGTTLSYPTNSSLPAPAGGTARKADGGYPNDLYQANLATPIPLSGANATYYFSYLLDNGAGNVDYAAQLVFGGSNAQIYAGFGYGSKDDVSVRPDNATPFGPGNTYNAGGGSFSQGFSGGNLGFVVGEIVTTPSGADTVSVKIFRYTAGGAAAALPVNASDLTFDATYQTTTTDTVTQLGIFEAGVTTPEIDAIRVGTAYADVVGTVSPPALVGQFTTYTGAASGAFDTTTNNFSFNGSPVAFANGNSVLFDNTATGTHNVVVASGGVSPSAVTFNHNGSVAGYSFTGGAVNSPGALTLVSSGTVTLGNANTFAGGTNLSNGTLVLAAGGTLTTSAFVVGGGTLMFNGGTLQAMSSSATFVTGTPFTVSAAGGTIDTQAFNITVGEALSGSSSSPGGGITKVGSGTLTLVGNSNYTGTTVVNAGTLTLGAGGSAGTILGNVTVNSGGTLNASVTDAIGYAVGFAVPTLTVNAGGTFVLGAGNEGYVTNLVVSGGTVSATAGGSFNFNTGYNVSSVASPTTGTISSDIFIRGTGLTITTAAGTTPSGVDLSITGRLLGGGGSVLTTNGPGTLYLGGTATYGGGTVVNGGTVVAGTTASLGPVIDNVGVALNGGARLALSSLSAPSATLALPEDLTYTGGGTLQLAPTPSFSSGGVNSITVTDAGVVALSIGSSPAAGVTHGLLTTQFVSFSSSTAGALDVGRNDVDLVGGSVSSYTALVATGYNGGRWNGPGFVSSAAATDARRLTALAVVLNDNGSGSPLYGNGGAVAATFDGAAPAFGDVLVKYTYYGDANLDGKINGADYARIDAGFLGGGSLTGWYNGDFNYDGKVDASDYTLIDNAFNNQGVPLASFVSSVAVATDEVAPVSAVPEPCVAGIAAFGAAGLLGRRRLLRR